MCPELGALTLQAGHVQHYVLRRLATSFSVKCKQRSQTSGNLVLSQMTVLYKQTNKQASKPEVDHAPVWGSLRLAPIIELGTGSQIATRLPEISYSRSTSTSVHCCHYTQRYLLCQYLRSNLK